MGRTFAVAIINFYAEATPYEAPLAQKIDILRLQHLPSLIESIVTGGR